VPQGSDSPTARRLLAAGASVVLVDLPTSNGAAVAQSLGQSLKGLEWRPWAAFGTLGAPNRLLFMAGVGLSLAAAPLPTAALRTALAVSWVLFAVLVAVHAFSKDPLTAPFVAIGLQAVVIAAALAAYDHDGPALVWIA
jgi:hypothetical protein